MGRGCLKQPREIVAIDWLIDDYRLIVHDTTITAKRRCLEFQESFPSGNGDIECRGMTFTQNQVEQIIPIMQAWLHDIHAAQKIPA